MTFLQTSSSKAFYGLGNYHWNCILTLFFLLSFCSYRGLYEYYCYLREYIYCDAYVEDLFDVIGVICVLIIIIIIVCDAHLQTWIGIMDLNWALLSSMVTVMSKRGT